MRVQVPGTVEIAWMADAARLDAEGLEVEFRIYSLSPADLARLVRHFGVRWLFRYIDGACARLRRWERGATWQVAE